MQAWDVLTRCQGQVRAAGMGGATGLDMGVALRLAEIAGADLGTMIELLPAAEAGMVAGFAKARADVSEKDERA
jgi:hypothetical protein